MWIDLIIGASIFGFSGLLSFIFNKGVFPLVLRFAHWTPTDLDGRLLLSIKLPLTLLFLMLGAYLGVSVPVDLSGRQQDILDAAAVSLGILLGTVALGSIIPTALNWYIENLSKDLESGAGSRLVPLVRRVSMVVIYALGAILVMDQLGINISPLVAGLGLGGLAVALAIQPTLANLFAGAYVVTEGLVSPGDYIELEGGISGYVVDVSWRSTRIRTWMNNLVVVPNSRFAETIITNYAEPNNAVNIYLTCGVSYDSDLEQVEQASIEVMEFVLEDHPDAVKEYGAWFGFHAFGDSNVDFWLFVQAKDRIGSFSVQSELMKRLHARFNEEGIVINYPVRTLQFPDGWGPPPGWGPPEGTGSPEGQTPQTPPEAPRRVSRSTVRRTTGQRRGASDPEGGDAEGPDF